MHGLQKKMKYVVLVVLLLSFSHTVTAADPIQVQIDGRTLDLSVPPVMSNDRVLVPFRPIFETLGASVEWDGSGRMVTARHYTTVIQLKIDSQDAWINSVPVSLDAPARILDGRTMVPIRFVAESMGAGVTFSDQIVQITTGSGI